MAGLGFKDFQVGEVLTAADVDGYLMQQAVMRFATAASRGSALGTATGTAVPLAEGMVTYLDDSNTVTAFNGTSWIGLSNFNARSVITATNNSWPVPTLASTLVRVIVIGAGGGGGGANATGTPGNGGAGGTSTFGFGAAYQIQATGGAGGNGAASTAAGVNGSAGFASGNGGSGACDSQNTRANTATGQDGRGGLIVIGYVDLAGVSTVDVRIGAGGTGGTGTQTGGTGGRGEVIVEYVAG